MKKEPIQLHKTMYSIVGTLEKYAIVQLIYEKNAQKHYDKMFLRVLFL